MGQRVGEACSACGSKMPTSQQPVACSECASKGFQFSLYCSAECCERGTSSKEHSWLHQAPFPAPPGVSPALYPGLGRVLAAARSFSAGETVFEDIPLVRGADWSECAVDALSASREKLDLLLSYPPNRSGTGTAAPLPHPRRECAHPCHVGTGPDDWVRPTATPCNIAQGPDECACLARSYSVPETDDLNDYAARVAARLPIPFNGDADSTRAVRPA